MGKSSSSLDWLHSGGVIPACRNEEDFSAALSLAYAPSLILLFGDVNTLPNLIRRSDVAQKLLLVHLDLLDGVGRDRAGIVFLARMGLKGLITTKPQLAKLARQEGLKVVQRMFLVDSESLRTGMHLLKGFRPDAIEVLPASTSAGVLAELRQVTDVPILVGGLVRSDEDVKRALQNGACAVSVSRRDLWKRAENID